MKFPAELKYTKDHEWVRIEGNQAYIGITEFAQSELGDIVYVDINTLGKDVLDANPELVNSDPYGEGWMVKIEVTESSQATDLLSAEDYKAQIGV